MTVQVSVADIKSHFSEYISKVAFSHQKIIITKRNKPIAALVDLDVFQQTNNLDEVKGLFGVIGQWSDFDTISENINIAYKSRQKDGLRNVSF